MTSHRPWGPEDQRARYARRVWAADQLDAVIVPDQNGHAYHLGEHGPTRESMPLEARAIIEARAEGREAGRRAGSWAADGNTSAEHATRVLDMLEAGDPEAYDYLPPFPNLSGEMADDPTPLSLAREIVGEETLDALGPMAADDLADAIAQAWEDGVSQTFEETCERELRVHLPEEEDTSEDLAQAHGFDVCPDCGGAGVKMTAQGYAPCTRFLDCWSDQSEEG